mgnify:CR=1 FL=1
MSDLDDEELEATRKLNGVAKKSNIEKDIKRCEQLIKPEHANWIGISNQLAIAHVVDRVKEVENDLTTVYLKGYADAEEKYKKRIKELEEALLKVKDKNTTLFITCRNSIPKQEVKDKIEEAKHNKKVGNTAYEYTEEDVWDTVKDELEELLEDK